METHPIHEGCCRTQSQSQSPSPFLYRDIWSAVPQGSRSYNPAFPSLHALSRVLPVIGWGRDEESGKEVEEELRGVSAAHILHREEVLAARTAEWEAYSDGDENLDAGVPARLPRERTAPGARRSLRRGGRRRRDHPWRRRPANNNNTIGRHQLIKSCLHQCHCHLFIFESCK